MEDVIKKYCCINCKNKKENCMNIIIDYNNDVTTYKCKNYDRKEEKPMNKEEVKKFINRFCHKCRDCCEKGLRENNTEIVCIDRNIHMKKKTRNI